LSTSAATRWSRPTIGLVAFALACASGLVIFFALPRTSSGGAVPSFGVLHTAAITLPSGASTGLPGDDGSTDVAHVALRGDTSTLFVVEAPNSNLCLLVHQADVFISSCSVRSTITEEHPVYITHPTSSQAMDVFGLVPDGVTAVTLGGATGTLDNNVFAVTDAPSSQLLQLTAPDGTNVIDLGPQVPPA